MSYPREVTVPHDDMIYRARVERCVTFPLRRPRWRYVIEQCWSQWPSWDRHDGIWRDHDHGPKVEARADAEDGGNAWLDAAELRAAEREDGML